MELSGCEPAHRAEADREVTVPHNPYAVTDRARMTDKQRLNLFLELEGVCCVCKVKIRPPKETWIVEHILPLWLGGTNDASNLGVAHTSCAHRKTAKEATERSRGRAAAERHMGAKRSRNPLPGGRGSRWKKKMDGTVIRRDE